MRKVGDVYLAHNAVVTADVTLGKGVSVWFGAVVRGDVAAVTVGAGTNLQDGVIVHCDYGIPNAIGENVVVGHAAVLHGKSVGSGTLVGIGATLLGRTVIGEECVIAAGAVVPPGLVVPPRMVVMGVPGRIVRPVRPEELEYTRAVAERYRRPGRAVQPGRNGLALRTPSPGRPMTPDRERRRADVDAKQAVVGRHLDAMGCDWALFLMPAHVAWLTGGMNVRGLIADGERPGVFANGSQRWLVCSNVDTQRLFDEELDELGFQLKEWHWLAGRAGLIGEIVSGKRVATDRPFPNMPLLTDRLRPDLRVLSPFDRDRYLALGRLTAHALEATGRALAPGESEEEVAGQIAHRLFHRGAEVVGVSVSADGRGKAFRRSGFTPATVTTSCAAQVTALKDGLFCTASRTVCFGAPVDDRRAEFDAAGRAAGVYRATSRPGGTVVDAVEDARRVLAGGPFEHEWRQSQAGYGSGWFPAEELRRGGQDDPFAAGQAVVWQARVGAAAVVDTVIVGDDGPVPVTPTGGDWPYRRVKIDGRTFDVPDVLVREG